jgi:2-polyprenyl-3-methyl-5-hydroxy-6-metoxy-1,4-benzoquinol methylase
MNAGFCPSHRLASARRLFGASDSVTGDRFDIVECDECGLARTEPQPSTDELDRYYTSSYHGASQRYRLGLENSLAPIHRRRIDRIEQLTGGSGRALDVGCGPGWFLERMRRRGWETRGTERSESAARQARDTLSLDVRAQSLDDLILEGASYDAIILWHVAEHMHDPTDLLVSIGRLLRPGGVLMIGVPNFGSPEARLGRAAWFHLDVPRHLFHFTPETLQRLLAEADLQPRKVAFLAPEYDLFSFVQTAQNRMDLPMNLLYDVLRRPQARLTGLNARSAMAFLAVALAIPLAAIGLLWTLLAAALGRGSTIIVYAQRPAAEFEARDAHR